MKLGKSRLIAAFKRKRGISPLIATIILISICVAGGLLIYNVFFSTGSTITAKGQVEITNAELIKSSGTTTFTITVKNTGNKPVSHLTIKLQGETNEIVDGDITLEPGQSYSTSTSSLSGTYTVGNEYTVTVTASFSDGSSFSDSIKVKCE